MRLIGARQNKLITEAILLSFLIVVKSGELGIVTVDFCRNKSLGFHYKYMMDISSEVFKKHSVLSFCHGYHGNPGSNGALLIQPRAPTSYTQLKEINKLFDLAAARPQAGDKRLFFFFFSCWMFNFFSFISLLLSLASMLKNFRFSPRPVGPRAIWTRELSSKSPSSNTSSFSRIHFHTTSESSS